MPQSQSQSLYPLDIFILGSVSIDILRVKEFK